MITLVVPTPEANVVLSHAILHEMQHLSQQPPSDERSLMVSALTQLAMQLKVQTEAEIADLRARTN